MDASQHHHAQPVNKAVSSPALVRLCEQLVAETSADGLSVCVKASTDELIHATDSVSAALDELQLVLGEGPAHDLHRTGVAARSVDLHSASSAQRWPGFAREAAATGARTLLTLPLRASHSFFGHVELYRAAEGELVLPATGTHLLGWLTEAVMDISPTTGSSDHHERSAHRRDLHIAAGITTVHLHVTIGTALELLYATSFSEQRPLQDICHEIVTGQRRLDPT